MLIGSCPNDRACLLSAAKNPPPFAVVPPGIDVFSKTITFAPFSAAVTAAETPAPPAPTTTTSAFKLISSVFSSLTSFLLITSSEPPAFSRACLVA